MKRLRADPGDAEFERRRELGLAGSLRLHRPPALRDLVATPTSAPLASASPLSVSAYRSGPSALSTMQVLHGVLDSVTSDGSRGEVFLVSTSPPCPPLVGQFARDPSIESADFSVMRALADYIAQHYASDLRMADLAEHVHVSVRTLQNLFHSHCGEPPLKALRRFRLHQLYGLVIAHPWRPLREQYSQCGLTGSIADRDFFLEIYGLTLREHQEASRVKSSTPGVPSVFAELPKAELRQMLQTAA